MRIGRVACLVWPSFVAGALAAGCSTPASNTELKPEGPPAVLQVFVTERAEDATALGLFYSGNEEYNAVDADGSGCSDVYEEYGDDCAVTAAVADGTQKVRIVFDELLDGSKVEEFVCACQTEASQNCPNMLTSALDPSQCGDNPDTSADESARFLDANNDGMPDKARLIAGLVTFTCDGMPVYTSGQDDGFYNPSGNQLIPVATELGGLGPALVVTAAGGLKTGASCSITINAEQVKDKQGEGVPAIPATATFKTEALGILTSSPVDAAINVPLNTKPTVTFNAKIDMAAAAGIILRVKGTTTAVATGVLGMDGVTVTLTPAAALTASTQYEIVVPATVVDALGGAFPAEKIITFTTGAT
jgi:hypothetical protein